MVFLYVCLSVKLNFTFQIPTINVETESHLSNIYLQSVHIVCRTSASVK